MKPQSLQESWSVICRYALLVLFTSAAFFLVLGAGTANAQSSDPVQSGSVGLSGQISAPPPTVGATISFPRNGQDLSDAQLPISVTGICPDGLLVKLFKNNVFAGSTICTGGNFTIQTDLFVGSNELIARVFDSLDQPGPDSNRVTVVYNQNQVGAPVRVTLTSNYAKRGADPGDTLVWPVILSGGSGPYAFSVDWGDGSEPELFSQPFAGTIDLKHIYKEPGVFNVVIKVVDNNGSAAFLQVVAVANGPLSQTNSGDGQGGTGGSSGEDDGGITTGIRTKIIWWPAALLLPFLVSTFWLGKRHMLTVMKRRIINGEHPFEDI